MFLKKLLRGFGALALIGVLLVALLLAGAWLDHRSPTDLPSPTGPFAVGRMALHWVEKGHPDKFAPAARTDQELVVWIWYPAVPGTGVPAEYVPRPWREALAKNSSVLMSEFLTRDLSRVRVHSRESAALAGEQRYPVVILRAGLSAEVTGYTVLAENLASHGYVVVAPDAAHRTKVVVDANGRVELLPPIYNLDSMSESEQVPFATQLAGMWSTDVGFVIDKLSELDASSSEPFAGHLDLQHIGIVGHSLGGATAAYFCHEDPRCKAGIDLDGRLLGSVVRDGVHQPFMFVMEDPSTVPNTPDNAQVLRDIGSMYARLPAQSRLRIFLAGSNHLSFGDQMLLKSPFLIGVMHKLHVIGRLNASRGLAITGNYVTTFFDVYLKGEPRTALDTLAGRYPEVHLE